MDFWFSYIVLAEIYVLLGLSTNLLVGIIGIFSVSQAAVFGVGAYIVAALVMSAGMGFVPAMLVAFIACVLLPPNFRMNFPVASNCRMNCEP